VLPLGISLPSPRLNVSSAVTLPSWYASEHGPTTENCAVLSGHSAKWFGGLLVTILLLAAPLVAGCKTPRVSSDSGAAGAPGALGSDARTFWLRNSPLLDASAKPIGSVQGPLLARVGPQGRVQSSPGVTPSVDGYLPASLLATPKDGEGLALYAQRQADLHEQSATGPVIGRVYPGAFVSVAPASPGYLLLALPAFRAAPQEQVLAVVEENAFGSASQRLQGPSSEGQLVRDFVNAPLWAVEFTARPVPPFASTMCGDVRVLSVTARASRISQYHAGVEIFGWHDYPIDVAQYCSPYRCKQRTVIRDGAALWLTGTGTTHADRIQIPSPPAGFLRAELTGPDALQGRIKGRLPVYWLTRSKRNTARCSKWTFDGVTERKSDATVSVLEGRMRGDPLLSNGKRSLPSFTLTYEPANYEHAGKLHLKGLHFNRLGSPPGAVGERNSYRAVTSYDFVGSTENALRMLNLARPANQNLVAWHPDDEERWFFSAEACATAASAASSALSAGSETPPGGFHFDCFSELNE
jgi:hypothetical protein